MKHDLTSCRIKHFERHVMSKTHENYIGIYGRKEVHYDAKESI